MSNYRRLMTIARRYHDKCEAYDLTVCTGAMYHGAIMPANIEQQKKIRYNAKFQLDWDIILGKFEGIKAQDIKRAIKEYRRRL